jgi:hypothetical protein
MPENCEWHLGKHNDLCTENPGRLRAGGHHLQLPEVEEWDRHHNGSWVGEVGGMERSYQEQDSCPDVEGGKAELVADGFPLLYRVGTVTEGVGLGKSH